MADHVLSMPVAAALGSMTAEVGRERGRQQPMTKESHVYWMLRDAISAGMLAPGTHLRVAEIAEALGTSPIPVRAALRTLDTDGLVEVRPHVGAFVTDLPIEDLLDILNIRAVLEAEAMAEVIERVDASILSELSMLCSEMDEATASNDTRSYARLNSAFHRKIYELSSSRTLIEVLHTLELRSTRGQAAFLLKAGRMTESNTEHRRICAALEARDVSALQHEVRMHRQATRAALLSSTIR